MVGHRRSPPCWEIGWCHQAGSLQRLRALSCQGNISDQFGSHIHHSIKPKAHYCQYRQSTEPAFPPHHLPKNAPIPARQGTSH